RCDSRPASGARVRPARHRARAGSGAGRRPPRHAALAGGDAMSLAVGGTRHLQALLGSLGRLARSPLSTFLTLLVISLALALPAALRLLVTNAQLATGNFANAIDVSVYLKTDVPLAKAQQLAQSAGQRLDVAAVTLIPADKGLEEFRTYSGFGDALAALKENPLPHVLHVRPRLEAGGNAALEPPGRYLGGALLAWGIVAIAVTLLGEPVATLAKLYGSRYVLLGPSRDDVGVLLGAGVALGWLGAWISAARHLRSIEPRA